MTSVFSLVYLGKTTDFCIHSFVYVKKQQPTSVFTFFVYQPFCFAVSAGIAVCIYRSSLLQNERHIYMGSRQVYVGSKNVFTTFKKGMG